MTYALNGKGSVYLSARLREKLCRVAHCPVTIVSAPIGYGKTTVLREYLLSIGPSDWPGQPPEILWQTLLGGGAKGFWEDFTDAFAGAYPDFYQSLIALPLPLSNTEQRSLHRALKKLGESMSRDIVLVLDDLQLAACDDVREFLRYFVHSLPPSFRLVLLERSMRYSGDAVFRIYGIANYLSLEDLAFSDKDIFAYGKMCGINISCEAAARLHALSAGWPAIIHINLAQYEQSGFFLSELEMFRMLREAIYDPLSPRAKEFLETLSICDSFTEEQAEFLWEGADAHILLNELTTQTLCLNYDRAQGLYSLSPTFAAYFKKQNSQATQQEMNAKLNRLAQWYLKTDENTLARRLYHRIKNYGALMDAVEKRLFQIPYGRDEQEFILYYTDCPPEIRAKHPKAILTFARQMFGLGHDQMGREVCAEFEQTMKLSVDMDEESRRQLEGTYELLLCYAHYNNLGKMLHHIKRASELLNQQRPSAGWLDGEFNDSISLLHMYHRSPGRLQAEVELFCEYIQIYSQLTGGKLGGSEFVMRAEALFATGDVQGAEIMLHKATLSVNKSNQWNIWLCATMLKMRIALMQGNWPVIEHLLNETVEISGSRNKVRIIPAIDYLKNFLYSKLVQPALIPLAFNNVRRENVPSHFRAASTLYYFYAEAMLARGEALRLIAFSEEYLSVVRAHPSVYAELVLHIQLTGAYELLGQWDKAKEHLKTALQMAIPDSLFIPFVEMSRHIRETLVRLDDAQLLPQINNIQHKSKEYTLGIKKIVAEHFSHQGYGLTNREAQIAKMAAMRLSNKEIAERLVISESTVKTQLARAFAKLGVNKRKDLELLFPAGRASEK